MRVPHFLILCIFVIASHRSGEASIIDGFPLISQFKSLVQVISGDEEGARRTQENFLNTAPVVSQVKSLVHLAEGNEEEARKTQERFAGRLEEIVDSVPVVGHVKGGIHMAVGDTERGENIIKGATSSTGAVIGGILGGPPGAVAGAVFTDSVITAVDSAVHDEPRPFGMVDYITNIDKKDAGEHFDVAAGVAMDAVGGKVAKAFSKGRGRFKTGSDFDQTHVQPELEIRQHQPDSPHQFGADHPPRSGLHEESVIQRVADEGTLDHPRRPGLNEEQPRAPGLNEEQPRAPGLNEEQPRAPSLNEDSVLQRIPDEGALDIARRKVNTLPESYRSRLERIDFVDVNDVGGTNNCYMCTVSAMREMTVKDMLRMYKINFFDVWFAKKMDQILYIYRNVGFPKADILFSGPESAFKQFVDNNLVPGQSTSFALAYTISGTQELGHVVLMRVWKDAGTHQVHYLTTDFQLGVDHPQRFSTEMPPNADTYNIIHPYPVKGSTPKTDLGHDIGLHPFLRT